MRDQRFPCVGRRMTSVENRNRDVPLDNRTAFWIAVLIIALLIADHFYLHWQLPTVVGRMVADLSEWLAFWR